jgi:hypothetical protein
MKVTKSNFDKVVSELNQELEEIKALKLLLKKQLAWVYEDLNEFGWPECPLDYDFIRQSMIGLQWSIKHSDARIGNIKELIKDIKSEQKPAKAAPPAKGKKQRSKK